LNAEVNALDSLQIVILRSKYSSCTVRAKMFGASSLPFDERLVEMKAD
jgi:hypothetical protein